MKLLHSFRMYTHYSIAMFIYMSLFGSRKIVRLFAVHMSLTCLFVVE